MNYNIEERQDEKLQHRLKSFYNSKKSEETSQESDKKCPTQLKIFKGF